MIVYSHAEGCSVIGGYVSRGSIASSLLGASIYGDYCSGKVWRLRYDSESVTEPTDADNARVSILSRFPVRAQLAINIC